MPARRRQVFPSVDTDRNGGVDQAEFTAFVMPRFASADTDRNGLLTAAEVQAADEFEYKLNPPSVFELSDRNGDGRVDEVEFKDRMLAIFDAMDADKDGNRLLTAAEVAAFDRADASR